MVAWQVVPSLRWLHSRTRRKIYGGLTWNRHNSQPLTFQTLRHFLATTPYDSISFRDGSHLEADHAVQCLLRGKTWYENGNLDDVLAKGSRLTSLYSPDYHDNQRCMQPLHPGLNLSTPKKLQFLDSLLSVWVGYRFLVELQTLSRNRWRRSERSQEKIWAWVKPYPMVSRCPNTVKSTSWRIPLSRTRTRRHLLTLKGWPGSCPTAS